MEFKKLDCLSPKIFLFYNGNDRHISKFGAVITIIMIIMSGIYVFYLFFNILQHNVSNFSSYKNYINEAGLYLFNDTGGIFHYFHIYDLNRQEFGHFNTKYIRAIMSRIYYKTYPNPLSENEHWVYDNCRDGIDNKNIEKGVIDDSFNKGVCLRHYYNNEKKKYFPIEDKENFKYPYLIHGSGRKDNLLLETIIEKCDNNSFTSNILGPCGPENEINDYLQIHRAIYFNLLEKQVDTENYKKSIYQYIYTISGSLDSINVPVNNVNFMPFFIELKRGIFLPKTEKIITYMFDDNRKTTWENSSNNNFLAIFDYWLVNSCQIIKGGYNNLYDILPNIGGIIQLIYYICFSLNYLFNKYIVIQDCNHLFFNLFNKENDNKEAIYNKKIFQNCAYSFREELIKFKNEINKQGKNLNENEKKNKIILKKNKKFTTDIVYNNEIQINNLNNNEENNSNDIIFDISKNNVIKNCSDVDNISYQRRIIDIKDKIKNEKSTKVKDESSKLNFMYYQFVIQLQKYISYKNKEIKVEPLNSSIISQYITFFNYILSRTGKENQKRIFFVLSKFREKILGEENLFRTKIDLYHLEKYFNLKENKKPDIIELYYS